MREIEFRAWDTKKEKYLNIDEIGSTSPQFNGYTDTKKNGFGLMVEFDDDIEIELFISIKAKNGKKIYKGDIIKHLGPLHGGTTWWDGIVTWHDTGSVGWVVEPLPENKHRGAWGLNYNYEYEVIGNIHENPELLKEEQ
jgi:uncharacterized phage protein (TIGR01671 family)